MPDSLKGCSQTQASPCSQPIVLPIAGTGNIIAFKNRKRSILDKRTGLQRTMTDAKAQAAMDLLTQVIESALRFYFQTTGSETLTEPALRRWIASSMPYDDSRQWIAEIRLASRTVTKGEEGAVITIERIT